MGRNHVNVSKDHIERLAKTNPLAALEELIWNGLDSGSKIVEILLRMNDMGGVQNVEVVDHGSGILVDELEQAFGNLGESKKIKQKQTTDGRLLHGKEGKGRFKALSLCNNPVWETTFKDNGKYYRYQISITHTNPDYYDYTELKEVSTTKTGTRVVLGDIIQGARSLSEDGIVDRLIRRFALYLSNYPGIQIIYDGKPLRVDNIIGGRAVIPFEYPEGSENRLTVIEWKFKIENKSLYLCNESGFCRHEMSAGVQAPGIDYSAYISSPVIEKYYTEDAIIFEDMHEDLQKLIELSKDKLREYLRQRLAEEAGDVVAEWKELNIYPYEKETANPIEQAEREVFNIVAVRVNEQHPTFSKTDIDNKKLTLALIKQALETSPSNLATILREVVKLPKEDQNALAELLKRTTLSSIIRASAIVAQRLDTIQAFDHILFDRDWKKRLLERTQLHRLLVHELWIFGEDYTLDSDDESLTNVLKTHIKKLGASDLVPEVDVKTIGGKEGIPDLLLSRRFTYSRDQFENLVIELKRPTVVLGQPEITQIEDYAMTVAKDTRFNTQKYCWKFILLGNSLDEYAEDKTNQDGLPRNCTYKSKKGNVSVCVRNWADVLAEAKQRYEFFSQKLEIEAQQEHGMENWREKYPHLLGGRGASKKKDLEATVKAQS